MKFVFLFCLGLPVLDAQPPMVISTTALPHAILHRHVSGPVWTLSASGGAPPYVWEVGTGALPAGLSLSSSGVIGGSATLTGAMNFGVRVTDSTGWTATKQLTIEVQTAIGRGCTTATVIDWDCDYYGVGSPIGMDADDNDPTVNTPESMLAKYATLANFLSAAKGYNPNHIWYIAPDGNDSTCVADDATKPCGGFATARAKSSAGDALVFRGGSHLGANGSAGADGNYFFMNRAGTTAEKPDIFMGYPGESAVITHKTTAGWYGFAGAQNYLTIDGLIIQPHVTDFMWTSMLMNVRGNNRVVRNCEMKYGYDGIWEIYSQSDVLIERNVIHDQAGEHNIYIGQNADSGGPITRYVVRDNLLYGAVRNNFHNNGLCNNCVLEGNIMYDANKAGGGGSASVALQMGWNHSTVQNNVILTASAYGLIINNYYDAQPAIVPNDSNYNTFANNTFIRTATSSFPEDLSDAGTPAIGIINDFNAATPKKDLGHNTWANNIFVECSANGETSVVSYKRAFETDDDWLATDTWQNNILWSCAGTIPLRSGVGTNTFTAPARDWTYFSTHAARFTGNVWGDPKLAAWNRMWHLTPERFDLRPLYDGPAIQGGSLIAAPAIDILGRSRTGTPDIGAYQLLMRTFSSPEYPPARGNVTR